MNNSFDNKKFPKKLRKFKVMWRSTFDERQNDLPTARWIETIMGSE
jgi:hypothetical protein